MKKAFKGFFYFAVLALCGLPALAVDNGTEFFMEDDLSVFGTGGTQTDPDVEIKGFTVFGSTQIVPALNIPAAPGNIFINGHVQISSGLYVVGGATFTSVQNLFFGDGTTGNLMMKDSDGSLTWVDVSAVGDNLGNHTATQALKMGSFAVNTSSSVSAAYYQVNGSTVLAVPGTFNIFAGLEAGQENTSGQMNTFVGQGAGFSNTTGSGNTYVGSNAGLYAVGGGNTALGRSALRGTAAAFGNTVVGMYAAFGASGYVSSSTLLGYNAGYALQNSTGNILIGFQAGDAITSGGSNILIGNDVDLANPLDSNKLNIGGLVLGDMSSGYVGINGNLSASTLTVQGNAFSVGGSTFAVLGGSVAIGIEPGWARLHLFGDNSENGTFLMEQVGTGSPARILASKSGGTKGAPVAVTDGEALFDIRYIGHDGGGADSDWIENAVFRGRVDGAVSEAANVVPMGFEFWTSSRTEADMNVRMSIRGDGRVQVGPPSGSRALLDVRDESAQYPYLLALGTGTVSERLLVSTSGAVGIGVAPSTQSVLEVHKSHQFTAGGEEVALGIAASAYGWGTGDMGENGDAVAGADFHASVNSDASLAYLVGIHTEVRRDDSAGGSGAGTIGKAIGLYLEELDNIDIGVGAITDTYGIYISSLTAGRQTNRPYAIYSEDSNARTYFAGNVGISSATPVAALVVSSAAGTGEKMLIVSTGTSEVFSVKGNGEVYTVGKFIGDGSMLTNLAGDGLGTHTATTTLQMGAYGINSSSAVSAAYYQIRGSTVLAVGSYGTNTGVSIGRNVGSPFVEQDNVFIGENTGWSNASGYQNTFVGTETGGYFTNQNSNTFMGARVAQYSTNGGDNSFFGSQSAGGLSASGGFDNSFFGSGTGYSNSGSRNIFVGSRAGNANTSGSKNTFVGTEAGRQTETGSANVVIGADAGYGSAGQSFSSSTLVGYYAGHTLTTGSDNILVGFQTGSALTTGSRNIIIGYALDATGPGASDEIRISTIIYGNVATGGVGIGPLNTQPQGALDVKSTATGAGYYAQVWRDGAGVIRASVTSEGYFYGNGSGLSGVAADKVSKSGDTMTGPLLLPVGTVGAPALSFVSNTDDGLYLPASGNLAFATGGVERLRISGSGRIGVGASSPAEALDIASRVQISTNAGNPDIDGFYSSGAGGVKFNSVGMTYMRVAGGGGQIGIGNNVYTSAGSPKLQVVGSMSVGINFNSKTPPSNSLIVEGRMGVGNGDPSYSLDISTISDTDSYVARLGAAGVMISTGGAIQTTGVGHGTVEGNARGVGAVDLQTRRLLGIQVASGKFSAIGGGYENIASGDGSVVAGGWTNDATANYAGVLAGYYNAATNSAAAVVAGLENTASGWGAFVGSGRGNTASGASSFIGGGGRDGSGVPAVGNRASQTFSAVVGGAYNIVSASNSFIGGGAYNTVIGTSAIVAGGENNQASGMHSFVGGGSDNQAQDGLNSVVGGKSNFAGEFYSFVGGGYSNSANTGFTSVVGGQNNVAGGYGADGAYSFIGGGQSNTISHDYGVIGGGMNNDVTSSANYSFIGGGYENTVAGVHAGVVGGWWNVANAMESFIGGGGYNTVDAQYGVIAGGRDNKMPFGYAGFIGGGELNQSTGTHAVVGGGYMNVSSGAYSAVLGGYRNTASSQSATVAGGRGNWAYSPYGFIGAGEDNKVGPTLYSIVVGGYQNQSAGANSVVGGGQLNKVYGDDAVVSGGYENVSRGYGATIAGGIFNYTNGYGAAVLGGANASAIGQYAAVIAGNNNTAKGTYSFAAGNKSSSTANGSFTWSDSQGILVENNIVDQVRFKARGGFWVSTSTVHGSAGLFLTDQNTVVIGTVTSYGARLAVVDPDPQLTGPTSYLVKVGTGPLPNMLTVSTSGVVELPRQSRVIITQGSTYLLPAAGWVQVMTAPSVEEDTQGEWVSSSFKTRTGGMYMVSAHVTFAASTSSNTVRGIGIGIDGSTPNPEFSDTRRAIGDGANPEELHSTWLIKLLPGSFIRLFGLQTTPGSINTSNQRLTVVKIN
ncbi:MAG TPA: hypothetical protein DDW67_00250 [Elusimicrobia bacterium]|nr:hypothetical protein [Elusimicrobiota bacterium]